MRHRNFKHFLVLSTCEQTTLMCLNLISYDYTSLDRANRLIKAVNLNGLSFKFFSHLPLRAIARISTQW